MDRLPGVTPARRWEVAAFVAFCITAAAGLALGVVYWTGGQTQAEGVLLGIAFGSLGWGLIVWANKLLHQGTYAEARHVFGGTEAERDAVAESFDRDEVLERRTLLDEGTLGRCRIGGGSSAHAAVGFAPPLPLFPDALGPGPRM